MPSHLLASKALAVEQLGDTLGVQFRQVNLLLNRTVIRHDFEDGIVVVYPLHLQVFPLFVLFFFLQKASKFREAV